MTNPDRNQFAMIQLADLRRTAEQRPPGYADGVLALAVARDDTHVLIPRRAYNELRRQHSPRPAPGKPRRSGPELWAALHAARDPSPALIAEVRSELGCGDCLAHFDALLAELPPVYAPLTAWRMRVTEWHNRVNARRGVAVWSYAASDARWPL